MITLIELKKIRDSVAELSPNVEEFSWGPSYEFALQRKEEVLNILNREIRSHKENSQ
jgi:hypothetical protein